MKTEESNTITQCSENWFRGFRISQAFLGQAVSETVVTSEPDFEEIQSLCSDRPIKFNHRPSAEEIEALEDENDVQEAFESLKDTGSISLDDFKTQLGI